LSRSSKMSSRNTRFVSKNFHYWFKFCHCSYYLFLL
jgi:hypothetical protein